MPLYLRNCDFIWQYSDVMVERKIAGPAAAWGGSRQITAHAVAVAPAVAQWSASMAEFGKVRIRRSQTSVIAF